jgi:hypothetical protein
MKKQILIVAAAALTAAVVIFNGTSAASAQQNRISCVKSLSFSPTYTELVTCLEMRRDIKNIATRRVHFTASINAFSASSDGQQQPSTPLFGPALGGHRCQSAPASRSLARR